MSSGAPALQIVTIGAGPAGLGAAAQAAARGVPHLLLESSPLPANTIQRYQKGKHVMAEPAILPLRSPLPFVQYQLDDPDEYSGENIVVGGADILLRSRMPGEHRRLSRQVDAVFASLNDQHRFHAPTFVAAAQQLRVAWKP